MTLRTHLHALIGLSGLTAAALAAWGLGVRFPALLAFPPHIDGTAQIPVLIVATLSATAIAALAATLHFASRHLRPPLALIESRLALLATGEPSTSPTIPATGPVAAKLHAIHAAIDRLGESALRRSQLQAELARLGDHVATENRRMLADLEAAARVQRAQLPASPRPFRGGMFHAFFRPCNVVAGDTYDCVTLPDGRTRVFQIDVSGHGAPAALVSIASHIALKQALLSAPPEEPLASVIATINRDWVGDLPYFTLLAVEIDPARHSAAIVQCGHPALLRLPASGGVEAWGNGGLPVGVLPEARFETLFCPFLPGDRLVLATDGVTEAADPDDRMFGDARLRALLTARPQAPIPHLFDRIASALWDWRGAEALDDDITILILEAT